MAVATLARSGSLRFGWRTPTAYDLWGDLEARVTAGLDSVRRLGDERARRRWREQPRSTHDTSGPLR